ncbi:MAG: hypothetical protein JXP36_01010 [Bacteroidales bacterium]|nr:hypothetical protein [Bacteroidales bacterium]
MKYAVKIVLSIWFLGAGSFLNAQHNSEKDNFRMKPKLTGTMYQKQNMYPGSEFLFDEWQTGTITLKNGRQLKNMQLNYNAYTNDLVYAIDGNTAVVVSKFQVSDFIILNSTPERKFILINGDIINKSFNSEMFVELLFNGNITIFANRMMKVNSSLVMQNRFNESVYYLTNEYYACMGDYCFMTAQNKRNFYSFFNKVEVNKIIRKYNLNLKKENDLVEFARQLNQLGKMAEIPRDLKQKQ